MAADFVANASFDDHHTVYSMDVPPVIIISPAVGEAADEVLTTPPKRSPPSSETSEIVMAQRLSRYSTVAVEVPRPINTCLVLSLSFAFVHTAYLAIQNLQSSLNDEANLGLISLSVLHGAIIVCATQAPFIIRLLGPKSVLVLAWVFNCLYTLSNFYPAWLTLMPSSLLVGAIAGPMWTAQGIYITAAGETHAMLSFKRLESNASSYEDYVHVVLSRFNSIFFMCYGLTHISGNLISSLVLTQGSFHFVKNSYDESAVCGPNNCPSPSPNLISNATAGAMERPEAAVVYLMLGIFLVCNVCGLLLTWFYLPTEPDKHPEAFPKPAGPSSSKSALSATVVELVECLKMLGDRRMVFLIPVFSAYSMAKGLLYADYTKAYVSCVIGVGWVGLVMSSFGIFSAIFTIGINNIASVLGRLILMVVGILFHIGNIIAMLVWHPTGDENAALYFLIPALSGISEGVLLVQFNTMIGQIFSEKVSPAFAAYHTIKAAALTITFALTTSVCVRENLYLCLALYILGFLAYLFTERSFGYLGQDETNNVKKITDLSNSF